jgi:hypothetical protein
MQIRVLFPRPSTRENLSHASPWLGQLPIANCQLLAF